jgi:hypothetical protein
LIVVESQSPTQDVPHQQTLLQPISTITASRAIKITIAFAIVIAQLLMAYVFYSPSRQTLGSKSDVSKLDEATEKLRLIMGAKNQTDNITKQFYVEAEREIPIDPRVNEIPKFDRSTVKGDLDYKEWAMMRPSQLHSLAAERQLKIEKAVLRKLQQHYEIVSAKLTQQHSQRIEAAEQILADKNRLLPGNLAKSIALPSLTTLGLAIAMAVAFGGAAPILLARLNWRLSPWRLCALAALGVTLASLCTQAEYRLRHGWAQNEYTKFLNAGIAEDKEAIILIAKEQEKWNH